MRAFPLPPVRLLALAAALMCAGCAVGPTYHQPTTAAPTVYKEAAGWVQAAPADTLDRGPWWMLFGDQQLNELAAQVDVSNQNVAASVAAYAQARALVQEQRAGLLPSVDVTAGATRSGGGANGTANQMRLSLGGSWDADIWGRLRGAVTAAGANAQASAADLAGARLSAQGELAIDYFSLRQTDAQRALLVTTIDGYQRVLQITQNRFDAGIAAKSDVLQAQTQLANARVDELSLARQRAQYEHAIAVLVGKAPADFNLPEATWAANVPVVPLGVPSTLLQRRPDIAAAERRVASANEQIGIARTAYYPSIGLSGSYGTAGSRVGDLFSASNGLWSFGLSAAENIFNGGATRARVAGAQAAHDAAVARYRQSVLDAFADVENQLAATRVLGAQQDLRREASAAADQVEAQTLNRYKAGQVSYAEVVQSQQTALTARRAVIQTQADRQTTAVALIQSLGGGWHAD
jgi:NodT family efflux transporter outer membrane factor (OMF) lipoprotein